MNFTKESKKFYLQQLKGKITNNFSFNLKSLHRVSKTLEQPPQICKFCKFPLTASICLICKTDNQISAEIDFPQNFIYKESYNEKQPMSESMILCIDLSGSMSITYNSRYHKINENLVKRVLGQKNFEYLKKKIGLQKVLKNYSVYQMLLSEGQSVRNIADMVKMEESHKSVSEKKEGNEGEKKQVEKGEQYISRKEIIEIAVQKCIQIMRNRSPNTQISVVYFNESIEVPTDDFKDKHIISGIQTKSVQQMISSGLEFSNFISKAKAGSIAEDLLMNLTKAVQNGQTALGPSLAFCFGIAQALNHTLNQIVVVTDGMSNIGFGQTQNQNQQQKQLTKKFYEQLALKYAKPLSCVVNLISFEDCCVGYDQLDRLLEITGGIPCQIQFTQEGGERIVTEQTFSNLSFKLITALCEYAGRLFFNTKTTIFCSNQNVRLSVSKDLQPFIEIEKGNMLVLKTGVISSTLKTQINFSMSEEIEQFEGIIRFMIVNEFTKNNKKYTSVTVEKVRINKGTKSQAEKEEAISLQKEIKQKLKPRQIFEQDLKQYGNISIKLQQSKGVVENLDQELLQKFRMKKEKLEAQYKTIDKLAKQKMSMRSRAQKSYNDRENDFDDDGFR